MALGVLEFIRHLRQLLYSRVEQVYQARCEGYEWILPHTWLLIYYPLLYFEDVAHKLSAPNLGHAVGLQVMMMTVFIVGPLLYMFLQACSLLAPDSWKTNTSKTSQFDQTTDTEKNIEVPSAQNVPDKLLQTPVEIGLSQPEVSARQKLYGPNQIWQGRSWLRLLWQTSIQPADLLVEAAAVLAIVLHEWGHLVLICALLMLSFRSSIIPERNSDEVVASLAWDSAKPAIALRDGVISKVTVGELVPGDVIHVSEGQCVPADGRVVASDGTLDTDQSAITGEHTPIEKYHGDVCYATTRVLHGDAFLLVVGTGQHTFVGKTAALIQRVADRLDTARPRHLNNYNAVLRTLGGTIFVLATIPALISRMVFNSQESMHQILRLAAGLAIVAVRFLLTSNTMTYRAVGASRLAKEGAIVQSTVSGTESLAGTNILCSDKTGTVTENRLTLLEPYCISCDPEELILTACLSSSPHKETLDPIDHVIARSLKQYPQAKANLDRYKILDYESFNVDTKRTQGLVESPLGERMLCVKGAPKAVLNLVIQDHSVEETVQESYKSNIADFALLGYRSLAIARKRENEKWELLGAIPTFDPPRFDTKSALRLAKKLGVSVKIFTGDASSIAKATIQSVGIGSEILEACAIDEFPQIISPELSARIERADAYAEVFPEHKEKILRALQERGYLVAATGDGVSDAPALRTADCGIAVEGATEAAQSAADIVFIKRGGLMSIVAAIQTSRQIFQQVYNRLARQTLISVYVMIAMLWYFITYGLVLNLRLLILNTNASDMVEYAFRSSSADVPFSKKPIRWSSRRLFREVIPLLSTLIAGSYLTMLAIPSNSSPEPLAKNLEAMPASRSQALSLHILLCDHWLSLLMHTDGRFWAYKQNMRALSGLVLVDVLTTITCVAGWAGQGHRQLSVMTACWVWIISLGTFGVAAGARYLTFEGQLLKRPLTARDVGNAAENM